MGSALRAYHPARRMWLTNLCRSFPSFHHLKDGIIWRLSTRHGWIYRRMDEADHLT
jgi:hypothetical protein